MLKINENDLAYFFKYHHNKIVNKSMQCGLTKVVLIEIDLRIGFKATKR